MSISETMQATQHNSQDKKGVLLLNMGGPETLEDIGSYLERLFSDPLMIQLPWGTLGQKTLARLVSHFRTPKVQKRYELIGGGSPLGRETEEQARALEERLGIPVRFAMRYSEPFAETALSDLQEEGVSSLVALPLYPQYSRTTTLSSLEELKEKLPAGMTCSTIEEHHVHPVVVEAFAERLQEALSQKDRDLKTHVLFTAHSIPLKYVKQGDPYVSQVRETVEAIVEKLELDLPWSLAFQSRIGPVEWQGPDVEDLLPQLAEDGVQQIVLQTVSFVAENLETLYDLDHNFAQLCHSIGIHAFHRAAAPGHSEAYIRALAALVEEQEGDDG